MCEVPSNAIMASEFLDLVDGFSIGSNDLTQLTLGIDRNSEKVAHLYDERNPAVKKLISGVIKEANARGKYVGICGQAPSDYPEFCQFLVEEGIGSISVQSDRIVATHLLVAEKEKLLKK
jgi:pyruvate,water dikinase